MEHFYKFIECRGHFGQACRAQNSELTTEHLGISQRSYGSVLQGSPLPLSPLCLLQVEEHVLMPGPSATPELSCHKECQESHFPGPPDFPTLNFNV